MIIVILCRWEKVKGRQCKLIKRFIPYITGLLGTWNSQRWWLLLRKAAPGIPEAWRKCVQVLRAHCCHRTPRDPATFADWSPGWSFWMITVVLLSQAARMRRCNYKFTICSNNTQHVGVLYVIRDKWLLLGNIKHFPDLAKTIHCIRYKNTVTSVCFYFTIFH